MKGIIKIVLVLILGIVLGIIANRNKEHLINAQFIRNHLHFRDKIPNQNQVIKSKKTMIFLAFGQSNAGNYGRGTYVSKNADKVFNYYKGDLYQAQEPLLGNDGAGSSVWTRVADLLIDNGIYDNVIIVPSAIGGTSVQCWSDGDCKTKLEETLDYLAESKIDLTHIFWCQGETDNVDKTTKEQYKSRLNGIIKIIRNKNINANFYISITSYFPYDNENYMGIDLDISHAQLEVITETKNVKQGPNTDSLNLAYYRTDGVHFNENGLNKLAAEWYIKIVEHSKK